MHTEQKALYGLHYDWKIGGSSNNGSQSLLQYMTKGKMLLECCNNLKPQGIQKHSALDFPLAK